MCPSLDRFRDESVARRWRTARILVIFGCSVARSSAVPFSEPVSVRRLHTAPVSTETVGQPRGHAMILAQVAQTLPDVAQSVPPLTSSDLSIFGLFWSAHIVVKVVMVGLLVSSIWVW